LTGFAGEIPSAAFTVGGQIDFRIFLSSTAHSMYNTCGSIWIRPLILVLFAAPHGLPGSYMYGEERQERLHVLHRACHPASQERARRAGLGSRSSSTKIFRPKILGARKKPGIPPKQCPKLIDPTRQQVSKVNTRNDPGCVQSGVAGDHRSFLFDRGDKGGRSAAPAFEASVQQRRGRWCAG